MPSLKRHDGYLVVDHRASPGLPSDFYEKLGVDVPAVGEGKMLDMATFTCSHCKCVVIINPYRTRERGYCQKCDHYICDICHEITTFPAYTHTPFDKIIDAVQAEQPNVTLLLSNIKGV